MRIDSIALVNCVNLNIYFSQFIKPLSREFHSATRLIKRSSKQVY